MPLPCAVGTSPGLPKFNQQFVPMAQDVPYNSLSNAQVSSAVSQGYLPSVPSTSIIPLGQPCVTPASPILSNTKSNTPSPEKHDPQSLVNFCMGLSTLPDEIEGST
uniref:Lysophospholipase NTE1 n=3 Tax=Lygus hesperus TaxID=30085 RepID=A0A0A9ZB63_LYGHE